MCAAVCVVLFVVWFCVCFDSLLVCMGSLLHLDVCCVCCLIFGFSAVFGFGLEVW